VGLEDKVLRLLPYKEPVCFYFILVFNDFAFIEFCSICYFEFLILF
jgi:hypothetical protein